MLDLQPIPALTLLVDRSLVEREGGATSEPRYTQLITVRGYLRERLAVHGEEVAADRLMADTAAAAARRPGQFGVPREALDGLERELNNFHAALEVLVRAEPARAVELAADLFGLWRTRHVREGREWLERRSRPAESICRLRPAPAGCGPRRSSRTTRATPMRSAASRPRA